MVLCLTEKKKERRYWFITHEWINYRSNSIARKGGPIYRDSFRKGERSYSSSVRKDRRRPHKSVRKAMLTTNLLFTQTFHKVRVSFCANSWRSFSVRFPRRLVVAGGSEVRDEGAQPENLFEVDKRGGLSVGKFGSKTSTSISGSVSTSFLPPQMSSGRFLRHSQESRFWFQARSPSHFMGEPIFPIPVQT